MAEGTDSESGTPRVPPPPQPDTETGPHAENSSAQGPAPGYEEPQGPPGSFRPASASVPSLPGKDDSETGFSVPPPLSSTPCEEEEESASASSSLPFVAASSPAPTPPRLTPSPPPFAAPPGSTAPRPKPGQAVAEAAAEAARAEAAAEQKRALMRKVAQLTKVVVHLNA